MPQRQECIPLLYADFKQFRLDLITRDRKTPIVACEEIIFTRNQSRVKSYLVYIFDEKVRYEVVVEDGTAEYTDFVANIQPLCNKVMPPTFTNIELDASGVIVGNTANLYNSTYTGDTAYLRGVNAAGDTDGRIRIFINGNRVGVTHLESTRNYVLVIFDDLIPVVSGDVILITVENCGAITATYEGVLYLEEL